MKKLLRTNICLKRSFFKDIIHTPLSCAPALFHMEAGCLVSTSAGFVLGASGPRQVEFGFINARYECLD